MGASGALNSEKTIFEFADRGSRMARPTSFEALEMTPLSHASRHLVVPIMLFGTNQPLCVSAGSKTPTF